MSRWLRLVVAATAFACASACGARRPVLPSGPGTPFPEAAGAYDEAVRECRGARTIEVTLGLSGRAGDVRLRGSVDAGFEAPDKVRLEMRAPIGRPIFILAAPDADATLYLPRDNRVLRNARAADVVEALIGLPLNGAELRALTSGCGFGVGEPNGGRKLGEQWVVVDVGAATAYLRQSEGRWRVAAAARSGLTVHYTGFVSGRASALRLEAPASRADVTAQLSDMNINVSLHPEVFTVDVPAEAEPLTLEELRSAGPLGRQ